VPRSSPFITPAQPTPRHRPPKGEQWLHEVKFDGYRVQLHKVGKDVVIFSRNGADFTSRWPAIAIALQELPAKSAIIDAEVVASNAKGMPDFAALHGRTPKPEDFCAWAYRGEDRRLKYLGRADMLCSASDRVVGATFPREQMQQGAFTEASDLWT
jgi:ATP dependent DNA ligase domain